MEQPLYVEGPVLIWVNHKMEEYFVLKTGKEVLFTTSDAEISGDEEREGNIFLINQCL